jgi:threonine/homoserine/homoserine lactone efflux protein
MLDPSVLPVFLLAVLALAVVPGPDLALIVSHAVARGVRAGVWCSVGIAVAGFLQTAFGGAGLGAPYATHAGHRRRRAAGRSGLSSERPI